MLHIHVLYVSTSHRHIIYQAHICSRSSSRLWSSSYAILVAQSLVCFSADPDQDWTPAFACLDDPFGLLHKLIRASDLTVCLDRYCAPDATRRRQVQAFEVWVCIIARWV